MKKVSKPMSLKEYEDKVKEPLIKEITKGVEKSYEEVNEKIRVIGAWWYVTLSILLILVGIALPIYGAATIDQPGPSLMTWIVIGVSMSILGTLLLFIRGKILKQCNELYVDGMDANAIYKIAINNFPDFELKEVVEDVIDDNIKKYTYKIGEPADIVSTSPLFKATYKDKYEVIFQSAKFHWLESSTDAEGNSELIDAYGGSGFASISTDKRDDDFSFCLNGGFLDSKIGAKKIKLENKEFVKRLKLKSNNPIKSRMMFTPLAMEEVLNYKNKIKNNYYINKPNNNVYFAYETTFDQFVIDASITNKKNKMIQKYYDDVISDFYSLYEKLGVIIIPPFL